MATFKKLDVIDLLIAQEGMTGGESRRVRQDYIEFAKTQEGRRYLREMQADLMKEIEDQAYMQLVREQGGVETARAFEPGARRRRTIAPREGSQVSRFDPEGIGITERQIRERRDQIIKERLDDIRTKAGVERQIRKGVLPSGVAQTRELEGLEMVPFGEDPSARRLEVGEKTGFAAQREANIQAGTRGAIGKELDYGGVTQGRRPFKDVMGLGIGPGTEDVVFEERDLGRRRLSTYEIDTSGGFPNVRGKIMMSDMPASKRQAKAIRGGKSPQLAKGAASKIRTESLRSAARTASGGAGKMLSKEEISRLPKNIKSLLPSAMTGTEVYQTATGYRVITPQFVPFETINKSLAAFEIGRDAKTVTPLPNLAGMSEEEMLDVLGENATVSRIDAPPRAFVQARRQGTLQLPPNDRVQLYFVKEGPGVPGRIIAVAETIKSGKTPSPRTVTRISKRSTITPDDEVRGKAVSGSEVFETDKKGGKGVTAGREQAERLVNRYQFSPQGRYPAAETYRGMGTAEAANLARDMIREEILESGAEIADPTKMTRRQMNQAISVATKKRLEDAGGVTSYLKEKLFEMQEAAKSQSSVSPSVANRIAQLDQTIANLEALPDDITKASLNVGPSRAFTENVERVGKPMSRAVSGAGMPRDVQYGKMAKAVRLDVADMLKALGRVGKAIL